MTAPAGPRGPLAGGQPTGNPSGEAGMVAPVRSAGDAKEGEETGLTDWDRSCSRRRGKPSESSIWGFNLYFCMCFAAGLGPCLMVILALSDAAWGKDVYSFVSTREAVAYVCGGALLALLLVLYLLDFFAPPHLPGKHFKLFSGPDASLSMAISVVAVVLLYLVGLFSARSFPSMPVLATVLCGPTFVIVLRMLTETKEAAKDRGDNKEHYLRLLRKEGLKRQALGARDTRQFYAAAMTAFLLLGAGCLMFWLCWALSVEFQQEDVGGSMEEQAFVRFIAPAGAGGAYLIFGFIVALRVGLAKKYDRAQQLDMKLYLSQQDSPKESSGTATAAQVKELLQEQVSRRKTTEMCLKQQGTEYLEHFKQLPEEQKVRYEKEHESHMRLLSHIVKLVGCAFLLMMGVMYVAAELVAKDAHIANLVLSFLGVIFSVFIAFVFVSFSRLMSTMGSWCKQMPLFRMALSLRSSDWIRATGVVAFTPVVPAVLVLSIVNQRVRKCLGRGVSNHLEPFKACQSPRSPKSPIGSEDKSPGHDATLVVKINRGSDCTMEPIRLPEKEKPEPKPFCEQIFTERVERILKDLWQWNWISVISKAYILSIVFICYSLSPRILNVFLAWVNSLLKDLPFGLVLIATFVSGLTCFLLPPVPGVPVYLFAGVIIVQTSPWDLWPSCIVATSVGFVLKLAACAMQQKLIGERLGKSIWVRSQCAIHQPMIRAIEVVLRQPGMPIGKVAILCGGPDWPTSVMAGLLKLPLLQMEIGTLPIILFVGPCTLSGAFYVMKGESEFWSKSANLMLTLTVLISATMWVAAGWAIQEVFDKRWDEVTRPLEKNIDLDWLDHRAKTIAEKCLVKWENIHLIVKLAALTGLLVEILVGHAFYWLASVCFGEFAVDANINDFKLFDSNDNGDGLVKTKGLIGLATAMVAIAGFVVLVCYLKKVRKGPYQEAAEELKDEEADWKRRRLEVIRNGMSPGSPTGLTFPEGSTASATTP